MDPSQAIRDGLRDLSTLALRTSDLLGQEIEAAAEKVWSTLNGGGRLFFCGNGGSAADAQHLAAEYVVRFALDRRALPALALTTDTSVLTAAGNDLGFERVFSRQLEALARQGDAIFLHSTSGESENLIHTAGAASALGVYSVGMLAKGGGRLAEMVDLPIIVPTNSTARAQELHLAMGHLICQLVDERFQTGTSEQGR
jgi:D-sedoheptulose 7-phosphate isomerase